MPGDSRLPIFVGDLAVEAFGPVGKSYPYRQAFRMVIAPKGVGLMGESDLATSYAIYELLDRLGCRWYMPSEMGEVIPNCKTIRLAEADFRGAPGTIYRGGPRCDAAYLRRNRLGGMPSICGFGSLEGYVSAQQREQHPQWRAVIGGQPASRRLKCGNPEVANAIADRIATAMQKDPQPTVSLFAGEGPDWDESPDDRALDAGDVDPIFAKISVSDRLLVLANRVASRLAPRAPDTLLLLSAYTTAVRAPLREQAEANVVPVIVASVYDRAHPLTEAAAPGNADLRRAIEGWGRVARYTGYYAYCYNLSEASAPNPMIARWNADIPLLLQNNCRFWITESLANFETSLPALYLAARLTWDPQQKPEEIINRLMRDYYGHAGDAMKAYWRHIDDAWTRTPAYAGAEFAYLQRFTPQTLEKARQLMDDAVAAAKTPEERFRVEMANQSLGGLEQLMKMRRDLDEGRFASLENDNNTRHQQMLALARQYKDQFAFGGATGMPVFTKAYADATRIAKNCQILTTPPIRRWKYHPDPANAGEAGGWSSAGFDDRAWKQTDVSKETWSNLGMHNYFGAMWYRTRIHLPEIAAGKSVFLWISSVDESAKVFINGASVPYADARGERHAEFTGCFVPVSFDITAAIHGGAENQVTILATRRTLNELGTGGLMGPVVVYCQR